MRGWNEQVYVRAHADVLVSIQRLSERDSFERNDGNVGVAQQVQEAGEVLSEKLVAQRVDQICTFEFRLNHLRNRGEIELAQIAVDERIDVVSVGAFEEKRPL